MGFLRRNTFLIIFIILYLVIFRAWLSPGVIFGGDFPYLFNEAYPSIITLPQAWEIGLNSGLGGFSGPFLWIYLVANIPIIIFGKFLGLEWSIVERLGYLFPYLIISFSVSWIYFRKLFNKGYLVFLASLVFLLNTFVLMTVGGGLVVISLSYILTLPIFYYFKKIIDSTELDLRLGIIFGLVSSFQIILDPRLFFISLFLLSSYFLVYFLYFRDLEIRSLFKNISVSFIVIFLLNAFWIIPSLIVRSNPVELLGPSYSSNNIVKFLSFATLENALGLLHPYYPENIFGKIGFMKPGYLIFPLFAFSSLLLLGKNKKENFLPLFFALISLVGIFMAKGASEPFGNIYIFLFEKVPGFQVFRDPFKWYALIALGFAYLIPFSVGNMIKALSVKRFNKIRYLPFFLFVAFFLFTLYPNFNNQLTGFFRTSKLPNSYIDLTTYLEKDKSISRVLWYPTYSNYGFSSLNHPAVMAQSFFNNYDGEEILELVSQDSSLDKLNIASVKYIVIPEDTEKKFFLSDRKYSDQVYMSHINAVASISGIQERGTFGKIKVYELPRYKEFFSSNNSSSKLTFSILKPTEYALKISNAKAGDKIVFSAAYQKGWVYNSNQGRVWSENSEGLNQFSLLKAGDYEGIVYFSPQDTVNVSMLVSFISLLGFIAWLIYIKLLKK